MGLQSGGEDVAGFNPLLRGGRCLGTERLRPPRSTEEGSLPAPLPGRPFWGAGGSAAPHAVPEALSRCHTLPPLLHAGPCSPGGMEERRS